MLWPAASWSADQGSILGSGTAAAGVMHNALQQHARCCNCCLVNIDNLLAKPACMMKTRYAEDRTNRALMELPFCCGTWDVARYRSTAACGPWAATSCCLQMRDALDGSATSACTAASCEGLQLNRDIPRRRRTSGGTQRLSDLYKRIMKTAAGRTASAVVLARRLQPGWW